MAATLLADGVGGGYGIHSEMFTTGLMLLRQAGKIGQGIACSESPPMGWSFSRQTERTLWS